MMTFVNQLRTMLCWSMKQLAWLYYYLSVMVSDIVLVINEHLFVFSSLRKTGVLNNIWVNLIEVFKHPTVLNSRFTRTCLPTYWTSITWRLRLKVVTVRTITIVTNILPAQHDWRNHTWSFPSHLVCITKPNCNFTCMYDCGYNQKVLDS